MKKQVLVTSVALASVVVSSQALALQTPSSINAENGIDYTPTVNLSVEKSEFSDSVITVLTPSVDASLQNATTTYTGFADLALGLDSELESTNYADLNLGLGAEFDIDEQHFVSTNFDLAFGHEASLDSNPNGDLTRLVTPTLSAVYDYTSLENPATARVSASLSDTSYSNYEDITDYSEATSFNIGVEYFQDYDAQTTYVAEVAYGTVKYKKTDPAGTKDTETYSAVFGIEFEPSAVTSFEARFGYLQQQYLNAQKEDFSGFTWAGVANWNPKSYSSVEFTTNFSILDATGAEDYVAESAYGASWSHDWNADWTSVASLDYTHANFEGVDQLDDTVEVSATGFYSIAAASFKTDISFGISHTNYATTGTASGTQESTFNLGLDVML